MKILSNIFFLLISIFLHSCSSESTNQNDSVNTPGIVYPISLDFNGELINLRNIDGDNLSDSSGGEYGINYHLLYGFNDSNTSLSSLSGRLPISSRKVEIYLAIPKQAISLGEHLFDDTIDPLEYFCKVRLKLNNSQIITNTESGKITISNFNPSTNIVQGTYEIITNDGLNQNYNLSGLFRFKLID